MIKDSPNPPPHTFQHPANAQRHVALGTIDFEGQVSGDDIDRRQVLRGIGQQGFRVQVRTHGK